MNYWYCVVVQEMGCIEKLTVWCPCSVDTDSMHGNWKSHDTSSDMLLCTERWRGLTVRLLRKCCHPWAGSCIRAQGNKCVYTFTGNAFPPSYLLDVVGFWHHVRCCTGGRSDAYLGMALVPGARCHPPCLGAPTLPGTEHLSLGCHGGSSGWIYSEVGVLHVMLHVLVAFYELSPTSTLV